MTIKSHVGITINGNIKFKKYNILKLSEFVYNLLHAKLGCCDVM